MREYNIVLTFDNGNLNMEPKRILLGSQFDNRMHKLVFQRPAQLADYDLILHFKSPALTYAPLNRGRYDDFVVPNSLTISRELSMQVSFQREQEVIHSGWVECCLREASNFPGVPIEPWPVPVGPPGERGEAGHSPYVGENGNWFVWDDATGAFADSGKKAEGGSATVNGKTGEEIELTAEDIPYREGTAGQILDTLTLLNVADTPLFERVAANGGSRSYDSSTGVYTLQSTSTFGTLNFRFQPVEGIEQFVYLARVKPVTPVGNLCYCYDDAGASLGKITGENSVPAGSEWVTLASPLQKTRPGAHRIDAGFCTTVNGGSFQLKDFRLMDLTGYSEEAVASMDFRSLPEARSMPVVPKALVADRVMQPVTGAWRGKTWLMLGDSITKGANRYDAVVNRFLQFGEILNKAVAGQQVKSMADNVTAEEVRAADLITLYGCLNDFPPNGRPIGTLADEPSASGPSFLSRLKYTLEKLFALDPTASARTVIIGTHNAADAYRPPLYQPVNGSDDLGAYVLAMGRAARYYGCRFIDMYHICGFNALNLATYTSDGLHLSAAGAERIGKVLVQEFLRFQPIG